MEGLKGEGLKKKTAFKQQMTFKQQDLMQKHCQLINVDVDDSSALTLKYHNNFP